MRQQSVTLGAHSCLMILIAGVCTAESAEAVAAPAQSGLMAESEYVRRVDALMAGVEVADYLRSGPPAVGLQLYNVEADSQGEHLGLAVGDILIGVDGTPIPTVESFGALRQRRPQVLEVWSKALGRHPVALSAERIGISYSSAPWHAEAAYLSAAGRLAAADRAMVAAGLALREDPELALAALAHAQASGYHGALLPTMQACAWFALGRYAEASAVGEFALRAQPSAPPSELGAALYGSALLTGRIDVAQAAFARHLTDGPGDESRMLGFAPYVAALSSRAAPPGDPLDAISGAHADGFDLTSVMRCQVPGANEDVTKMIDDVASGADTVDTDAPDEHRGTYFEIILPQVGALECALTLDLTCHQPGNPNSIFAWTIGDPGTGVNPDTSFRTLDMDFTQIITGLPGLLTTVRGLPMARMPIPHRVSGRNTYHLRLALADGMVGTELDGVRIGRLPVIGKAGPKSIYLFVCDGHLVLKHLRLVAHDAQPPPGWKPVIRQKGVVVPPPPVDAKGAGDF